MPSSVQWPLMSEAKQDDLYRASVYRILTNATILTLIHDEGRFRMRNSQCSSIFCMAFYCLHEAYMTDFKKLRKIGECHLIFTLHAIELDLNEYVLRGNQ